MNKLLLLAPGVLAHSSSVHTYWLEKKIIIIFSQGIAILEEKRKILRPTAGQHTCENIQLIVGTGKNGKAQGLEFFFIVEAAGGFILLENKKIT